MFHRLLAVALCTAVCVAVAAPVADAQMKIGYIRSDYIFNNYKPYQDAEKQLTEYQKTETDKLDAKYAAFQKKVEEAQSKAILMTDEAKQSKQEELQKEQQDIEAYHQNLLAEDGPIAKKQAELMQPIFDRINEVLMSIAKTEMYDFVFDASSGPGGNILYANDKLDISDQILEELKKDTTG